MLCNPKVFPLGGEEIATRDGTAETKRQRSGYGPEGTG